MKKKKASTNIDYSKYKSFNFRIPADREEDWGKIKDKIENLYSKNKLKAEKEDRIITKRNEIIIDALMSGLKIK
jgi:ribose 5-phosphate isomerase